MCVSIMRRLILVGVKRHRTLILGLNAIDPLISRILPWNKITFLYKCISGTANVRGVNRTAATLEHTLYPCPNGREDALSRSACLVLSVLSTHFNYILSWLLNQLQLRFFWQRLWNILLGVTCS